MTELARSLAAANAFNTSLVFQALDLDASLPAPVTIPGTRRRTSVKAKLPSLDAGEHGDWYDWGV